MKDAFKKQLEKTSDEDLLQAYCYVKSMNEEGIKAEYERRGQTINKLILKLAVRGVNKRLDGMKKELKKRGIKYD